MLVMQIVVFFITPLLEYPDAANEVLKRGWTARASDQVSVTFSKSFETEADFDADLAELKAALGPSRYSKIEFGAITADQGWPER